MRSLVPTAASNKPITLYWGRSIYQSSNRQKWWFDLPLYSINKVKSYHVYLKQVYVRFVQQLPASHRWWYHRADCNERVSGKTQITRVIRLLHWSFQLLFDWRILINYNWNYSQLLTYNYSIRTLKCHATTFIQCHLIPNESELSPSYHKHEVWSLDLWLYHIAHFLFHSSK